MATQDSRSLTKKRYHTLCADGGSKVGRREIKKAQKELAERKQQPGQ